MKLRGLTRFIAATIGIAVLCFGSPDAGAVESSTTKIATVNIQEVLLGSTAGQEVKKMLEAKVDALRAEIEKKSSVWSPEVKDEKERDYQKRVREVQLKTEDAQFELQQMEKQLMSPILNELQQVIKELGEKNGYTLIMDSRAGLLYVNESLDISDIVQQELDKRQQKEKK